MLQLIPLVNRKPACAFSSLGATEVAPRPGERTVACFWGGVRVRQRKPRACRGFECVTKEKPERAKSRDAPILSQGTNQARRTSRKRPDPPHHQRTNSYGQKKRGRLHPMGFP